MEYAIHEETFVQEFPSFAVVSGWFGLIVIGVTAVSTISTNWVQSDGAAPFLAGMQFILIAFILASILFLAVRAAFGVPLAALPLIINLGTMLIIQFVPFDHIWEDVRFTWQQADYEEVVVLVQQQALLPNAAGKAPLPAQYRHLSNDAGQIWIAQDGAETMVFFPTEYVSTTQYAGYFYRTDNQLPQDGYFNGHWRLAAQKRPFWFFCVSAP